jgi:hypothetical protein
MSLSFLLKREKREGKECWQLLNAQRATLLECRLFSIEAVKPVKFQLKAEEKR